MEVNFITEGLKFMLLGMTTVFLFLLLMIYILKLQEKLIKKFFPQKVKSVTPTTSVSPTPANEDAQLIAVITAAITDFKTK